MFLLSWDNYSYSFFLLFSSPFLTFSELLHLNIINIYCYFQTKGFTQSMWVVMELCDTDLQKIIDVISSFLS
jgi:serine/threonine protein kinase